MPLISWAVSDGSGDEAHRRNPVDPQGVEQRPWPMMIDRTYNVSDTKHAFHTVSATEFSTALRCTVSKLYFSIIVYTSNSLRSNVVFHT